MELARLRRCEARRTQCLYGPVGYITLRSGKRRRVAVPAQASANVLVNPHTLPCELVSDPMQLEHLIEQRLELLLVDSGTVLLQRGDSSALEGVHERGRKAVFGQLNELTNLIVEHPEAGELFACAD